MHYGNIQPNPLESKVWLQANGTLKTYDSHGKQWRNIEVVPPTEEKPVEPREIEFTIEGIGVCKCMSGMTWSDWCNSEYNPHTWENVLSGNSIYEIYALYDKDMGEDSVILVYVYDHQQSIMPEPEMTDTYTLAYNGVELRASATIVNGAIYSRYQESDEGSDEITFNAWVIVSAGVGLGVKQENQTFTALDGMTWKEYIDSEYGQDSPFFYYEGDGVFINNGDAFFQQDFGIFLDETRVSENDKIIANAQYDNGARNV